MAVGGRLVIGAIRGSGGTGIIERGCRTLTDGRAFMGGGGAGAGIVSGLDPDDG